MAQVRHMMIHTTKAGKQLRTRFHQPIAWYGTAEIVRQDTDGEEGGAVIQNIHTPYYATHMEAEAALSRCIEQQL